ncbi:MAG: archease [Candidatus Aenigmarchaeota archaeon]|nr:archease [Candidatus Aenigmarchaeota archaeon]
MSYKYLEDVSIADVAFVAEGSTMGGMFESAGLATTNVMVKDLKSVKKKITKKVKLESDSVEKLLFEFLQEFVYWKDKDLLLFSGVDVSITGKNKRFFLNAALSGEKINPERHEMLVDVKAVTWHLFSVEKKGKKWRCQVVLDI